MGKNMYMKEIIINLTTYRFKIKFVYSITNMQQQWLDILYSYVEKEYLVIRILYDWNRDNGI